MNLAFKHNSGIYPGLNLNERYYWFQDGKKEAPMFPATLHNKLAWDLIRSVDTKKLDSYVKRITRAQDKQRSSKMGRLDEIDLNDNH